MKCIVLMNDCSIRITDCSIRVYRFLKVEGLSPLEWGGFSPLSPPLCYAYEYQCCTFRLWCQPSSKFDHYSQDFYFSCWKYHYLVEMINIRTSNKELHVHTNSVKASKRNLKWSSIRFFIVIECWLGMRLLYGPKFEH